MLNMHTPKEILLETLKPDGKPERLLEQFEAFSVVMNDPCQRYTRGMREKGKTVKDRWGTTIVWPADQHAAMPHVTADNKVLPDVTRWREYIHVPDLVANCTDWTDCVHDAEEIRKKGDTMVLGFMGTGVFEECHHLMGFEDTLSNLLIEPEAMHELIDVIGEFRLTYAKLLVDNLKPDCILSHDDWGNKTNLFMHPDVWREFFKPQYVKIYGYMKDHGVLVMHHADSYCEQIVEDMVDIGIDIWQGVLNTNNIPKIQRELNGKMTLMGGIDSWIDRRESEEPEIRAEVRRAMNEYAPGGHYIPCITYGGPGTIFPHVDPIITDEIRKYNKEHYNA